MTEALTHRKTLTRRYSNACRDPVFTTTSYRALPPSWVVGRRRSTSTGEQPSIGDRGAMRGFASDLAQFQITQVVSNFWHVANALRQSGQRQAGGRVCKCSELLADAGMHAVREYGSSMQKQECAGDYRGSVYPLLTAQHSGCGARAFGAAADVAPRFPLQRPPWAGRCRRRATVNSRVVHSALPSLRIIHHGVSTC